MAAVGHFADNLLVSVAASAILLGIFAFLLAVVGPILVVSLGVEVVRWAHSLCVADTRRRGVPIRRRSAVSNHLNVNNGWRCGSRL